MQVKSPYTNGMIYKQLNVAEDHIFNFLPKPMSFRILSDWAIYNKYWVLFMTYIIINKAD